MTHDPRFPDEDFEDEPVEWEIAENPGVILSLRFNGDEIREIGQESRETGIKENDLVRSYVLDHIHLLRSQRASQAEVAD